MPVIPPAGRTERAFLACAAGFLLIAPFPSSAGWRVFFLLAATAALVWRAWRREAALDLRLVPRPFLLAALVWAALCASSLAWSADPGYTLQELRRELLYGALTFVVFFAGTREPAHLHLWLKVLLAGALILGLGEWLRQLFPAVTVLRKASLGSGTYSTHVLLVAPLLVIVVWPPPMGLGRSAGFTIGMAVVLMLAGLATDSRILWLALLVAAAVAFVTFRAGDRSGQAGRGTAKLAFLAALAILPLLMWMTAEYKLRVYPLASGAVESLAFDERPFVWDAAMRKLEERPWLGHGYGREIVGDAIRKPLEAIGSKNNLGHGHNVFLDAALQLGMAGWTALIALFGAFAWALASLRRHEESEPLAIAGLAILAGYLTKNLTDDFFFRPNSLVFWAIAGMLLGAGARVRARS